MNKVLFIIFIILTSCTNISKKDDGVIINNSSIKILILPVSSPMSNTTSKYIIENTLKSYSKVEVITNNMYETIKYCGSEYFYETPLGVNITFDLVENINKYKSIFSCIKSDYIVIYDLIQSATNVIIKTKIYNRYSNVIILYNYNSISMINIYEKYCKEIYNKIINMKSGQQAGGAEK